MMPVKDGGAHWKMNEISISMGLLYQRRVRGGGGVTHILAIDYIDYILIDDFTGCCRWTFTRAAP